MKITFKLLSFFALVIVTSFLSCRKADMNVTPEIKHFAEQFFKLPANVNPEVARVAQNLKKQDAVLNFLPSFIKKNGIPNWENVLFQVEDNKVQSRASARVGSDTSNKKGLFLIPLQSTTSNDIKSYITCYKDDDSTYRYRLYNKDSLDAIKTVDSAAASNMRTTMAVFGYFEKKINNKNKIDIKSPKQGSLRNVKIKFDKENDKKQRTSVNSVPSSNCSATSISVTVEYEWREFSYGPGEWVATSITVTIVYECAASTQKDPSDIGTGGGAYGSNSYWWLYGTGWPWNTDYYNYNWNNWWTTQRSNPIGGGISTYFDPVNIGGQTYTTSNYPGMNDGYDWKWWEDADLLQAQGGTTFGTWAINYLAQNPQITFVVFQNQFMSTPEGEDGDYDANYWDDPSLVFAPKILPSWNDFNANYPKHHDPLYDTPVELYTAIGGGVLSQYNTNPPKHQNTCALRISKALNDALIDIPAGPDRFQGKDGKYYFLSAAAMRKWMMKTFGTPTGTNRLTGADGGTNGQNFPGKLANKKGIYFMTPNYPGGCPTATTPGTGFCASGHADMINNGVCDGGCYFGAKGGVSEILIWELQ